ILRAKFGERVRDRVKKGPPPVKDRVTSMNSRLKATNGDIRMLIDPARCPNLVKDLEGVTILKGSAGEIDKSDLNLTHLTDALGYYIHAEFSPSKHRLIVGSGARF
ncbi:MAG: hypothetical protein AAGC77_13230, partial [Pseudomonadota bacterium]